jgi:putative ATP-binding cassette transporter
MELAHLAPKLDRVARWERELPREDQQRLAFARLLLHKPRWIVLDEALDHLDEDTRRLVLDVFGRELVVAAIVNIGQSDTLGGFFKRILHLVPDSEGQRLVFSSSPAHARPSTRQKASAG